MKTIYLAGGCFWGVEEYFSRLDGVVETEVGYANGHVENPTYREVCTGQTGHVEAVKIVYDSKIISLDKLLSKFWSIIDPTVLNRQGPDIGSQYRTGIYYVDEEDLSPINASLWMERVKYDQLIVTEILPLESFYRAEEEHQQYLKKNPGGYCHIDLDS